MAGTQCVRQHVTKHVMTNSRTYRAIVLALAMIFGVFNVGIPVIVASCSMPEMMGSGYCSMCDKETQTEASLSTTNGPCCLTSVTVEGNTSQFVASKTLNPEANKLQCMLPGVSPTPISGSSFLVSNIALVQSSPPHIIDIPISISSLLI